MTSRLPLPLATQRPIRLATAAAALLLAVAAPRLYAQARIGVVDLRRVVAESNEGRAASDAIKTRFDARQADLNRRTREIENLKRRLEHPPAPIPMPRLQKLAQQYQRRVLELQNLGQQYTQELQQIEAELTKSIVSKTRLIAREVGQSDNYQIIIDEQMVHFVPNHLNLTDRVIQLYNQRNPVTGPIRLPEPGGPQGGPGGGGGAGGPSLGGGGGAGNAPPTATPDAGARGTAPTPPAGTGRPTGPAAPSGPSTPPSSSGAPDAGRRSALPGLFFRRDAGH
jgi:outer membrane protein